MWGFHDGSPSTSISSAAAALFDPAREFPMMRTVKSMREVMAISFERITGRDVESAAPIANTTEQVR